MVWASISSHNFILLHFFPVWGVIVIFMLAKMELSVGYMITVHARAVIWSFSMVHFILKVVEAVASIGARRRFIEALAPLFGRPLEADPVGGHAISIFFLWSIDFCIWYFIDLISLQVFCRKATVVAVSGTFNFLVWDWTPCFIFYHEFINMESFTTLQDHLYWLFGVICHHVGCICHGLKKLNYEQGTK